MCMCLHAYCMLRGAAGSGNGGGGGGSNFPGTGFVSSTSGFKPTYTFTNGYVLIYYQYLAMAVPTGYILSASFSYTGGSQSYTVPSSITSLFIIACGGQGANGYSSSYGGNGGCITIVKTVTPSTLFYVFVGGAAVGTSGGYSGGAGGGSGSGGGASDLRTDIFSLATRCMYL